MLGAGSTKVRAAAQELRTRLALNRYTDTEDRNIQHPEYR